MAQIHELGLRIQRGQIPMWKIPAVFRIMESDALGKYLRLVDYVRREIISAEQIQALIEGKDEDLGIFKVTVDYNLTQEQMIAAGKYDQVGPLFSEHLPISGEGKVEREVVLVGPYHGHWGNFVLEELGLRPARIEELLALAATHPDLQKKLPIVALGSRLRGHDQFPYVCWSKNKRCLTQNWGVPCSDYRHRVWLLAVREDAA